MKKNSYKVIELFAGMGTPSKALKQLGYDFKVIDVIENNPTAIKAYNALHNTNFQPQNIETWDKNITCDYLHASPPCQPFSTAGKNMGAEDKRGLNLWEHTIRIIEKTKPEYITVENVKGILNKKHLPVLKWFLGQLDRLGYDNYLQIFNAKEFDTPQNRERVFIISSKDNWEQYRSYEPCYKCIKDILDPEANWIEKDITNIIGGDFIYLKNELSQYNGNIIEVDYNKIFKLQYDNKPEIIKVATIKKEKWEDSKTLRASADSKHECKLMDISFNQDKSFISIHGISGALTTTSPEYKNKIMTVDYSEDKYVIRYRKLTTLEVLRLMGYDKDDYNLLLSAKISNNQICKLAGNAIVVNVMKYIITSLIWKAKC